MNCNEAYFNCFSPTKVFAVGCVLLSLPLCISSMSQINNCSVDLSVKFGNNDRFVAFGEQSFWNQLKASNFDSLTARIQKDDLLQFDVELTRNKQVYPAIKNSHEFCYFHGSVVGFADSHAAINLCYRNVNGIITVGSERFVLEGLNLIQANQYNNGELCTIHKDYSIFHKNRRLRRNVREMPSYYSEYLDGKERYVELVIVNDYSMYARYNYDVSRLEDRSIQIANIINSLYQPVNIKVGLVHVEVWTKRDFINISEDGDGTLKAFLHYRKVKLLREVKHDNAQFLSDKVFSEGVVGKALKGTMCSYDMSGGINMDHSRSVVSVASTIAHEMGHNFGMEHDNDTCDCPQPRCIMAPSSGGLAPHLWSTCSLEYLQWGFKHGLDYCLLTPPDMKTGLFRPPTCGNGFVEEGEECDCGLAEVCDNSCCNATICKLASGAECASGKCCDKTICRPYPKATVCRASAGECDLAEFCSGDSEICPKDFTTQAGTTCSQGYCSGGKCGSYNGQCALLWGKTGRVSADVCFALNTKGSIYGNCNYDKVQEKYDACNNRDVMCGRLHCEHENERTEYGDKSVVHTAHTFLTLGGQEVTACRVTQIDLGLPTDRDPGLVPDGANCGTNKMCESSKCVEVSSVLSSLSCAVNDCSKNGVCNNNGHCHCNYGYGGDACDRHGYGGSIDSNAAFSSSGFGGGVAILILFLVLVPVVVIAVLFWYRRNKNHWISEKLLRIMRSSKGSKSRPHRPAPPPPQMNGVMNPVNGHIVHSPSLKSSVNNLVTPVHLCDNTKTPSPASSVSYGTSSVYNANSTLGRRERIEITPPLPNNPVPDKKPDTSYLSQTLPRNLNNNISNPVTKLRSATDYNTIGRKGSFRPEAPPPVPPNVARETAVIRNESMPERPQRPRESVMERLYAEKGQELGVGVQSREPSPLENERLLPSNKSPDLLQQVMAEVETKIYDDTPINDNENTPTPMRRAPPPPSNNNNTVKPWQKPPVSTLPKPGGQRSSDAMSQSVIEPPKPAPKPATLQRTLSNSDHTKPAPISLQRSSSNASSRSSGRSQRPPKAPPAPPKKPESQGNKTNVPPLAKLDDERVEFDEIDDEENIYDDIMVHSPNEPPPLPLKPTETNLVTKLAAKFDPGLSRLL